ncbi:hypothetical protein IEQ34_001322 [Dendrobium chrysotoxum]|uniref:DUF7792 domain-containing protein n=1 Tax=Dendrobium chrysotoxum TaxID=161865 RepID=A0AAV7HND9_DENCH|nr:hypothetical protein IEQ34_026304 [Dendrobium chrysotoxum]KAH0469764.1 hypothetical protein IEQ34_001322 [Dendrobium chrysotoxum]
MGDGVMQILAKPIQLADQVTKLADDVHSFRAECQELKSKTDRLAALLRQAARAELYERPARRIMDDTEQLLDKALSLIAKCRANGIMKRMFTIIPAGAFRKMLIGLDNSIGNVSWLLRVSAAGDEDGDMHLGLPPIAQNEPILFLIWEQIATLHTGNLDARADAAASLVSLARDKRCGRLIIEEDGVGHLLRLVKEGRVEGQENAARALGLLGRDPESVERMVIAGVCSVFSKVLKESPMKVQAMVAWAVSELAANHPKCQDIFAQNNVVRLLVGHLAFETVEDHSKYTIPPKVTSIHTVVMANITADPSMDSSEQPLLRQPIDSQARKNQMHDVVQYTVTGKRNSSDYHSVNVRQPHIVKGREFEDLATKSHMKAMAARALWQLARGNSAICKSITESKALLCFVVLLEKGENDVQYNSAMALMEIARVAEDDAVLRHSAFKPTSPTARSIVDQLLRVIEKADYNDLLVPCITAIGCLSRTFRATEKRIIGPLVRLLDDKEGVVMREAAIALTKFACTDNYLHLDHSKAIINAGGAKHLVQLVYFGEQMVQIAALILLSYIALHVPESEELAIAEVLAVLEWASKQGFVIQDPELEFLLPEAKGRLELYQSRGSAGYH